MAPQILPFVARADIARPAAQKSHANGFGRVTPLRQAQALRALDVSQDDARAFWADLVRRRCGSPEACAVMFGVTGQTARYWFEAFSRPQLNYVLMAFCWWPDDFAALRCDLLGVDDDRVAA